MESRYTDADAGRNREAIEALKRENDRLKVTSPRLTGLPWLDSPSGPPWSAVTPEVPGREDREVEVHENGDSELGVVRRSEHPD